MAISKIPSAGFQDNVKFRNLIINGSMDIAQRGTSTSSITASGYYTIDRFKWNVTTADTVTLSQSTDTPSGQGLSNSFKVDVTTADTSIGVSETASISHRIEAQNVSYLEYGTSSAKTLTLSFWVKSNKTGAYCIALLKTDNTRYDFISEYTISSANTWEKKTITIAPDSNIKASGGAIDNDNGEGFNLEFILANGSNRHGTNNTWNTSTPATSTSNQVNFLDSTSNEWYITGVQLEAGQTASEFEFLPVDVNLQRCQRYFYQIQGNDSANTLLGIGFNNNASSCQTYLKFPTTMRSTPSITSSSGLQTSDGNSYTKAATGVSVDSGSNIQMSLNIAASGLTVFRGGFNTLTNSSSSHLALSSEL